MTAMHVGYASLEHVGSPTDSLQNAPTSLSFFSISRTLWRSCPSIAATRSASDFCFRSRSSRSSSSRCSSARRSERPTTHRPLDAQAVSPSAKSAGFPHRPRLAGARAPSVAAAPRASSAPPLPAAGSPASASPIPPQCNRTQRRRETDRNLHQSHPVASPRGLSMPCTDVRAAAAAPRSGSRAPSRYKSKVSPRKVTLTLKGKVTTLKGYGVPSYAFTPPPC